MTLAGKRVLRIIGERFHPTAQLVHTEIVRSPHVRHASLFDQPHNLKLETPV
jgi:hypothetical protein